MNSIVVVSYNRLDLLKQTLDGIVKYCTPPYELIVVDNGSTPDVSKYVIDFMCDLGWKDIENTTIFNEKNLGGAAAFNIGFKKAKGDVIIHMDSDIVVPFEGWNKKLEDFLLSHKEVGIVGPDTPGHCLRIHRSDNFDEMEFVLGGVWGMRKGDFERYGGWDDKFDVGSGAYEIEHCYRLRMVGFRVGILRDMYRNHLDEATAVLPRTVYLKGTFDFLKEVNKYHLGFFHWKSPMMLCWEELPINILFRKQLFAQEGLNLHPQKVKIQDHNFELIQFPNTIGHYNELGTRDLVSKNRVLSGIDEFENCSEDLLRGKVKWSIELDEEMDKRRRK